MRSPAQRRLGRGALRGRTLRARRRGSTRSHPDRMRLELLRSWLRLTAKLRGIGDAERSRRWLLLAMRLRAAITRESSDRAVVTWLRSGHVSELLDPPE